jgi:hypothetical protein
MLSPVAPYVIVRSTVTIVVDIVVHHAVAVTSPSSLSYPVAPSPSTLSTLLPVAPLPSVSLSSLVAPSPIVVVVSRHAVAINVVVVARHATAIIVK